METKPDQQNTDASDISFDSQDTLKEADILQKIGQKINDNPELKKKCRELIEEIIEARSYAIGYRNLCRNKSRFIHKKCVDLTEDGTIRLKQNMHKDAYLKTTKDLIVYNNLRQYYDSLLNDLTLEFMGKMNSMRHEYVYHFSTISPTSTDRLIDIIMNQPKGTSNIFKNLYSCNEEQW